MSENQTQSHVPSVYDRVIPELLSVISSRQEIYREAACLPQEVFLKECQTIRISAGRQTGKTSWIINNIRPGCVVVVKDNVALKSLTAALKEVYPNIDFMLTTVFSLLSNPVAILGICGSIKYNTFIVDDASYVFGPEEESHFFNICKGYSCKRTRVIMLG